MLGIESVELKEGCNGTPKRSFATYDCPTSGIGSREEVEVVEEGCADVVVNELVIGVYGCDCQQEEREKVTLVW